LIRNSRLVLVAASLSLAGALAAMPAGAVGVVNGDFETGDFTGWTLSGDFSNSGVFSGAPSAQSGTYGASFGPVETTGEISQTLATVAGTHYTLDFWLQAELDALGNPDSNSFVATWGGATVKSLLNSPVFGYTHMTFDVIATGASTVLGFTFRNDPSFWDLDNVSVTAAVPEPETWALFGLGLAALAVRRRRRSARR